MNPAQLQERWMEFKRSVLEAEGGYEREQLARTWLSQGERALEEQRSRERQKVVLVFKEV